MDFWNAIAPAVAELLRVIADYVDDSSVEFEQPQVPDVETVKPEVYRINDRGGFETVCP